MSIYQDFFDIPEEERKELANKWLADQREHCKNLYVQVEEQWKTYSLETKIALYNSSMANLITLINEIIDEHAEQVSPLIPFHLDQIAEFTQIHLGPKAIREIWLKNKALSDAELKRMMEL